MLSRLLLALIFSSAAWAADYTPKAGDLIFQALPHNPLVDAIEGVSRAPVSHCGIVVRKDDAWQVLEALGTVSYAPLSTWIQRGRGRQFFVCRFKSAMALDLEKFIAAAQGYLGRNYDIHYAFDNSEIYCSELAFYAYREVAGKPLGTVRRLGDMNWQPHEAFIRSMENGALPLDREMITPVDLSRAPELVEIYRTGKK